MTAVRRKPWRNIPRYLAFLHAAFGVGKDIGDNASPRLFERPDDLAARWRITAMAAQRAHAHANPRLRRDHQFQYDVMEVGPMIPTIAARAVHDLSAGGMVAVRAAMDRCAGSIDRHQARGKAQTLGSRGHHETIEFGDAIIIERLESQAERISMKRRRERARSSAEVGDRD